MPAPLLVTALAIEAKALRSVARRFGVELLVVGPGPSCAERLFAKHTPNAVLIAGVAGGLVEDPPARTACVIDAQTGERFTPDLAHDPDGATLLTTAAPAFTPSDKAHLARTHDAHLVDMESAPIARACIERGVPWGVVRTVSDGPDEALPPEVARWTTDTGNTRIGRVLLDTLKRPSLARDLTRLQASTSAALRTLAHRVEECLDELR